MLKIDRFNAHPPRLLSTNMAKLSLTDIQPLSNKLSFSGNASDIIADNWSRVVDGEFDQAVPEMPLEEWHTCLRLFLRKRVSDKSFCAKWTFNFGQPCVWGFRYGERAPNGVVEIVRFTKRYNSNTDRINDMERVMVY
jgi:hypothetical protein